MKDILIYVGIFTAGVSAVMWSLNHFTPLDHHEALAAQVQKNTYSTQYQNCMSEYYFLRNQSRQYPSDGDLKQKVKDVKKDCETIKERMK